MAVVLNPQEDRQLRDPGGDAEPRLGALLRRGLAGRGQHQRLPAGGQDRAVPVRHTHS